MRTLIRHVFALALLIGITVVFLFLRSDVHALHRFNRSVADASYLLLCLTLILGPLVKMVPRLRFLLPWRRELGIAFTVSALVHVVIYARSFNWSLLRFFAESNQNGGTRLLENAFAISNIIGVIALLYALVLFVTSNDFAQNILGKGWKFLQQQSYTLFVLVILHFALFIYMVTDGESADPFVKPVFLAGGILTIFFQLSGYFLTVWQRSRQRRRKQKQA